MIFEQIKNWDEACLLANSDGQNCEGTRQERFNSGWANAADMIDDGELDPNDDKEVIRIVLYDIKKFHDKRKNQGRRY